MKYQIRKEHVDQVMERSVELLKGSFASDDIWVTSGPFVNQEKASDFKKAMNESLIAAADELVDELKEELDQVYYEKRISEIIYHPVKELLSEEEFATFDEGNTSVQEDTFKKAGEYHGATVLRELLGERLRVR